MKIVHEWRVACSIVKQQNNVEWDVIPQEIFLYLQDKVLEKQDSSAALTCSSPT